MRVSRLYVQQPLQVGEAITLDSAPAHYVRRVLRLKTGAQVVLFNGDGDEFTATILRVGRKDDVQVSIDVQETVNRESALQIVLGICISRGERMDVAIQKSVELGVQSMVPLISQRCVVRLDESRQQQRYQHWLGVIQNACEQSGRTKLPELLPIQQLSDWLCGSTCGTRLIMDPLSPAALNQTQHQGDTVSLLVGPEGGFDPSEREMAIQEGFQGFCLGPRILRAETAVLAGVTALQLRWGDFGG